MWISPIGAPSSPRRASMRQKKALLDAVDAAVKSEAWKKDARRQELDRSLSSGDDFGKLLEAENARITEILKGIGLVQ